MSRSARSSRYDYIEAKVIVGGAISNDKGVNLPGTILDLSPLTAKDRADLEFGLRVRVDWVALSFAQKPSDMIEARALIGKRAGLMANIEKPAALERIDDIVQMSDAMIVARGDLGGEIPHEGIHSTALSDHTSPAARWLPIDPQP